MPTVGGRPKLTRPLIVETALRLLDTVGLDELSTRRLALEFGVKSPALYWHFDSKQSLLGAMGDEIILRSRMGSSPTDETWQAWVLRSSRGYRAELLRHRRTRHQSDHNLDPLCDGVRPGIRRRARRRRPT